MKNTQTTPSDTLPSLTRLKKGAQVLGAAVSMAVATSVIAQTPPSTSGAPSPLAETSQKITAPGVVMERFSYPVKIGNTVYPADTPIPLLSYIKDPEGVITLNLRTWFALTAVDKGNTAKLGKAQKEIFMDFVKSQFGETGRYYYSTAPDVVHGVFEGYGKKFVEHDRYGIPNDYIVTISPTKIKPPLMIETLKQEGRIAGAMSVQSDTPRALKHARDYGRKQGALYGVVGALGLTGLGLYGWSRRRKSPDTPIPTPVGDDYHSARVVPSVPGSPAVEPPVLTDQVPENPINPLPIFSSEADPVEVDGLKIQRQSFERITHKLTAIGIPKEKIRVTYPDNHNLCISIRISRDSYPWDINIYEDGRVELFLDDTSAPIQIEKTILLTPEQALRVLEEHKSSILE